MERRIAVVGLGYVGATAACGYAALGHDVLGIDIDTGRVGDLAAGRLPIHEPGLEELLADGLAGERLTFSSAPEDLADAGIVVLCLPTPEGPNGRPDTSILFDAAAGLSDHLPPDAIVVTKSTVPVGTTARLEQVIDRGDLRFVSNPEFLREGSAVYDFMNPDRIVIGSRHDSAIDEVAAIHNGIEGELIRCDSLSAELIKYAANAFLATKLSFVNEVARICDELGGDVDAVVTGLGTDHRIASSFLQPGPGWGGSCFPKDVAGLANLARSSRLRTPVIEAATASNRDHLDHIFGRILALVAGIDDPVVALWGLAFKAHTDDVRSSPALELIERLSGHPITLRAADPVARVPDTVVAQGSPLDVAAGADLLVVATEWPAFAAVDPTALAATMRTARVLDLRRLLDPAAMHAAGIDYLRLGGSRQLD